MRNTKIGTNRKGEIIYEKVYISSVTDGVFTSEIRKGTRGK
jgi:hypothetical protein